MCLYLIIYEQDWQAYDFKQVTKEFVKANLSKSFKISEVGF